METTPVLITVGISLVTALGTAAVFIWKVSSGWSAFQADTKNRLATQEKDLDELVDETHKFRDSQNNQWNDVNRTLGRIEGGIEATKRRDR